MLIFCAICLCARVSYLLILNCDYKIFIIINFCKEMDTDKNVDSGMEFVKSSLLERLKDDDPTVVQAVLHLTDEV